MSHFCRLIYKWCLFYVIFVTNILNFGGGAFVGTAYMLGSLLAFDQLLVLKDSSKRRKSFFDYVDDAKVSFEDIGARVDDVLKVMPQRVLAGAEDSVSKFFDVGQGISGGSLLAWSVLGSIPLAHLVKSVLEFDARVYFHFENGDLGKMIAGISPVLSNLAGKSAGAVVDLFGLPFSNKSAGKYLFDVVGDFVFDAGRSIKGFLPSGIFSGEGLEKYVENLAYHSNLPLFFDDFRKLGRHLIIIAERLNYVQHMQDDGAHETEVFFGMSPYEANVSIARAIRASCSLPGLVRPVDWYDSKMGRDFQLVDGGVSKTIGFRKINGLYSGAGVWVVFNPIIPHESRTDNVLDLPEQILRRLIYNRKCAVWDYLEPDIKGKVILFEGDTEFKKSLFAWSDMKEALWRGYRCGLEQVAAKYDEVASKLSCAGLSLASERLLSEYICANKDRRERYGC